VNFWEGILFPEIWRSSLGSDSGSRTQVSPSARKDIAPEIKKGVESESPAGKSILDDLLVIDVGS
jgi:hypothetical protein